MILSSSVSTLSRLVLLVSLSQPPPLYHQFPLGMEIQHALSVCVRERGEGGGGGSEGKWVKVREGKEGKERRTEF